MLNTDSQDWLDVQASNVTSFLTEHKSSLRKQLVSSSIKLLKSYRLKGFPKKGTVHLLLGLCSLEIEDSSELTETIKSLENALESFFSKSTH